MKKILLTICMLLVSLSTTFAYTLSERDNTLLDKVEDKLVELIDDESNKVTAEFVVNYLEKALVTKRLSEKSRTLVEVIIDDISYIYYLWEYEDDFEDVVLTADDCYEDEYFEDGECIFDEQNYNFQDEENYDINDHHSAHTHEKIDSDALSSYEINWDTITLLSGEDTQKSQDIWKIFTTLIPLSARQDFLKYSVVDESESDSWAYVEQDAEDNNRWNMTINLASFYHDGQLDTDYVYSTLIHEFAHVLTLSKTQVRYYPVTDNESVLSRFDENCQTNLLQEWCLDEDAYLDDFIDTFWPDSEYLAKVRNEEINAYLWNETQFVTDYAATNPGEDIAESFTYFVTQVRPSGNTIADKKMIFFYDYKNLDILRKQIRTRLEQLQ